MKPTTIRYTGYAVYLNNWPLKRVQTFNTNTDFSEERILELSNQGVAEIIDDATVTASIEANDYGSIDNFILALGQGFYSGTSNMNRIFTDDDFENAVMNITVKMSSTDSSLERSMWLGWMFLTGFSLSYSVDGVATESYSFEGEYKRHFLNDYKDIWAIRAYGTSVHVGNTAAAVVASGTENNVDLTGYVDVSTPDRYEAGIAVVQNGKLFSIKDDPTLSLRGSFAGVNLIALEAHDASTGALRLPFEKGTTSLMVLSGTKTSIDTFSSTPAGIGGVRKGMVELFMWNPSSGSREKTLRVQSATIDATLNREEKVQLGDKKPYFRRLQRPLDISISLELNDSDLEEYAKLAGQESGFDASTLKEISLDDFKKTNRFEVVVYNSEITHDSSSELKRIVITDCSVSSEGASISVGENGTVSLTLTADNFLISGSGVDPIS